MVELRGFTKLDKVKEEKQEETKLVNHLLAKDYVYAITNEMFESMKDLTIHKIDDVCYWLNYDGVIGRDKESMIETIKDGSIMTSHGRSFKEACAENGYLELSWSFDDRKSKTKVKKL